LMEGASSRIAVVEASYLRVASDKAT